MTNNYAIENDSKSIQSVCKCLDILDRISKQKMPVSLSVLTAISGHPKSTVHRMLQTLIACNYVEMTPNMHYVLGHKALLLGALSMRSGVATHAREFATALRDKTQHTVYLATLHEMDVVYVLKFPGQLTTRTEVGTFVPANCSSLGRTILAYLSAEKLHALLGKYSLQSVCDRSITDKSLLLEELALIRQQGFARGWPEVSPHVESVAAPIFSFSNECIAAINVASVQTVSSCITNEQVELVVDTAQKISKRMGYLV